MSDKTEERLNGILSKVTNAISPSDGPIYLGDPLSEIEYAEEGLWYPVENQKCLLLSCCDCCLNHRYEFRVRHSGRGHKIEYRVFRLDKETAAERRRMDKKGEWRLK